MTTSTPATLRGLTDADADAVLRVVSADDQHQLGRIDTVAEDVTEWWAEPRFDRARDCWLLVRGDQPAGYAQVRDGARTGKVEVDVWVVDEHDRTGFDLLLDAAERRAAELCDTHQTQERELLVFAVMGRAERAEWLTARGHTFTRRFYRMRVELQDRAAVPEAADGVTVEPVGEREDVQRAYHALMTEAFAEHWGFAALDFDLWLARVKASPNLDWATVWMARVDGEPAAGLKMRLYDDLAWVDTLGTLKAHRGRGLGMLLLRTAFAESMRRGQPVIELGVDTDNVTSAVDLYERAGMSVAFAHDAWAKPLA